MRSFHESKKADRVAQQSSDAVPEKPPLPPPEEKAAVVPVVEAEPRAKPKAPVGPVARTAAGMRKVANKRTSSSSLV